MTTHSRSTNTYTPYSHSSSEVLAEFHSTEQGIEQTSVARRQQDFGKNILESGGKKTLWHILVAQFKDVLIMLLLGASVLSFALGEYLDASVMMSIVLLSAVLGFVQEFRAEKAVEALQNMAAPQAKVLREGQARIIPAAELVPGDVLLLEAGDIVPADARLLETEQLKVDEAPLTGESLSVNKHMEVLAEETQVSDQKNMVFLGTSVVHGEGRAVVTSTGMSTQMGRIAKSLEATPPQPTPLQVKFAKVTRQIALAVGMIIVVVFVASLLRQSGAPGGIQWLSLFLFSLSLAVAAVPSSLPAIVTIGLAMGTRELARKKMIIKQLPTAESLGAVTWICSDKTGTLTRNEMTVTRLWRPGLEELIEVSGVGYQPRGEFSLQGEVCSKSLLELPLRIGFLCNNAEWTEDKGEAAIVGDPTEGALLVAALKSNLAEKMEANYSSVVEFPFDSDRKKMSGLFASEEGQQIYVKGAPDVLLNDSTHVLLHDGQKVPLNETWKQRLEAINEQMASQALRVLALATKEWSSESLPTQEQAEEELTLVGLVGMLDPPQETVKEALKETRAAGIGVLVITGDHALTARAVARDIGLLEEDGLVLTGQELERMEDEALQHILPDLRIVARALPEHKLRLVELLQKQGHIVAMTGDGVNDAPALKKADVALAMGVTGTDVAKEVSDAILVDDNFTSIVKGVEEGRNIYDKILMSMRYLLSCNAGEVALVFFAVLVGLPLPLLPLQILWMNLITDGLPALALGVEPVTGDTMRRKPRSPDENPLGLWPFVRILAIGCIMGLTTLALFWMYQSGPLDKARSVAFTGIVVFEMLAVLSARSLYSWRRLNPLSNPWLALAILSSLGLQALLLYVPVMQKLFKTTPLNLQDWGWIGLLCVLGFLVVEVVKGWLPAEG